MIRAFLDASVLYAAITSASGASRELLKWHKRGELRLVFSEYVRFEVERNLAAKAPQKSGSVELLIDLLDFDLAQPDKALIQKAMIYTEAKDAPVIAGALAGDCSHVLSFDKQHLLGNTRISKESG